MRCCTAFAKAVIFFEIHAKTGRGRDRRQPCRALCIFLPFCLSRITFPSLQKFNFLHPSFTALPVFSGCSRAGYWLSVYVRTSRSSSSSRNSAHLFSKALHARAKASAMAPPALPPPCFIPWSLFWLLHAVSLARASLLALQVCSAIVHDRARCHCHALREIKR